MRIDFVLDCTQFLSLVDAIESFVDMSTRSGEISEEIVDDNRPTPTINGDWNQQTIVDARNVLQTQQSCEPSQQTNEQRSGKSTTNI